ncbi:alpha/beta fold hydrolase|uniref:Pimeloyl-[acyl-carrier protein] methyl ester esterase n=1 Tax=Dendrosporobacter quercicolus TaxID=146817 RepID=A0A1G9L754_9FIRM|nr:alpha/beta fold hydrolase [Dendrosporobacter quercicolus]NSL46618.1 alpha/beta fold hydrolase [Dendrosporobacter quercicolus DSM 1736]SDL57573.1 pimeloyl-[acyl-carrier protein] methyl ester esterase [Dendrosporobacter quercicolus]
MPHPLFFIHGWASTGAIWPDSLRQKHSQCYDAPNFPDFNCLSAAFLTFTEYHKQPITVIGWSLGGLLALQLAAAYPNRIYKIILVSSTARFTNEPGYTAGLSPAIVKRLAKQLNQDPRATQRNFYTLMFSSSEQDRIIPFLQNIAPRMASLHPHSLSKGLNFLLEADYRSILPKLQTPCAIIHGTADTICPVDAAHIWRKISLTPAYTCSPVQGIFRFILSLIPFLLCSRSVISNDLQKTSRPPIWKNVLLL